MLGPGVPGEANRGTVSELDMRRRHFHDLTPEEQAQASLILFRAWARQGGRLRWRTWTPGSSSC